MVHVLLTNTPNRKENVSCDVLSTLLVEAAIDIAL